MYYCIKEATQKFVLLPFWDTNIMEHVRIVIIALIIYKIQLILTFSEIIFHKLLISYKN